MKEKILQLLKENDGFVSGQEISAQFGVSRTSIWKAVRQLVDMGYDIEAVRNRGYRLLSEPDLMTSERVAQQLDTVWAGKPVLLFDSVDSTNNEAKRQAEAGAGEGLLVIGEEQTAGRGRRGREWASQRGEGIFMSLLLKPQIEPGSASMLTLVMGLAVQETLQEACGAAGGVEVLIKWPNDIVIGGRKVCGILTEMSAEVDCINHIVIGVGINVHNETFPAQVDQIATSLFRETGLSFCRAALVASCLKQFEKYYEIFLKTLDLSALKDLYNACLVNQNREVSIQDRDCSDAGIARGINTRGELLVDTPKGQRTVLAGEVSVRGVYGYI